MPLWLKHSLYFFGALLLVVIFLHLFPLTKTVSVETQYGTVLGKQTEGVKAFLGLPFAQAPVADLRWKKPQALQSWQGSLKAFKKSPACLQGAEPNPGILTGESEDCLYLNIWVPEGEGPFPVMFWYHGGGFLLGSASEASYDGHYLAAKHKVAVVSSNYRLGYQGYLRLPEMEGEQIAGNQAYYDQIAALQWVKDNGSRFSMDTDNITVFGESAGSMSVCMLLASPLTNDLIDKAIMQSGSCELKPQQTISEAEEYGLAFLAKIGCKQNDAPLSCARSKSHEQIYAALDVEKNEMFRKGFKSWSFAPAAVKGTAFLPDDAFKLLESSAKKSSTALMIGVNANEGSLFDGMNEHAKLEDDWQAFLEQRFPELGEQLAELYPWDKSVKSGEVTAQILSDMVMICPSLKMANLWSRSRPTYFYYFNQSVTAPVFNLMALSWDEHAGKLGVAHSTEIPYIFGVNGVLGFVWSDEQKKARLLMSKAWADFAKTGSPHPAWPNYSEQEGAYMEFSSGVQNKGNQLRKVYCEYWNKQVIDF